MADMEQNRAKRKLSELRVIDLRSELENRGLDKGGVKTALIERLSKALLEEGKDPNEFVFDVAGEKTSSKVPLKRSSRSSCIAKGSDSEVTNEEEEEDEEKQDGEDESKSQKEERESKESVKEASKDAENDVEKKKASDLEDQQNVQCNGSDVEDVAMSPPKPENAPVINPLTVEDLIKMDTSAKLKASDNDSMIVNPDDTQSDMDSSVNEGNSVCDESMQEEAANNSVNSDAKPQDNISTQHVEREATIIKDGSELKKEVKQEPSIKTEITTELSQKPSVETGINIETPEKGKAPKTGSDTTKAKSSPKKVEGSGKGFTGAFGKKAFLFLTRTAVKRVVASSRNLWVSGLAEKTRANDLKTLFSKYGKVSGAKIVTNARTPGTRCYGFITMSTSEESALCIDKLNHTELHGRMIAVEKTTREPSGTIKRADLKVIQSKAVEKKTELSSEGIKKESPEKIVEKTDDSKTEKPKIDKPKTSDKSDKPKPEKKTESVAGDEKSKDCTESTKEDVTEGKKERKRTPSREREGHSRDRSRERRRYRERRSRSRERHSIRGGFFNRGFRRGFGFRSYNNRGSYIDRYSRDRDRIRESPDRRFSDFRQREIERKNKEESLRLERERERLRIEREKLERERADVLRLEREKQRMERERLEREKAELRKRTAITLDDRRGIKRGFDSFKDLDPFLDDRKRRREPSLEPSDSFREFSRDRGAFPDRRGDRFEGRGKGGDASPTFGPSRREGRHDHDSFQGRNRNARDGSDRGRDDWKAKSGRDRSFDRGNRNSFSERGGRNFDRPHPWESGAPDRVQKFDTPPTIGTSQWAPVNKPPESWGRIEPPPQERWGNLEHNRSQPAINLSHPPNIGPPNPMVFGAAPGNEILAPMGGHFPVDRFNINMRRF